MLNIQMTTRSWSLAALIFLTLAPAACKPVGHTGECPPEANRNKACDNPGESCDYAYDECGGGPVLMCSQDHKWVEIYDPKCCSGGAGDQLSYPDCPDSVPAEGDECVPCTGHKPCAYPVVTACGSQTITTVCDDHTGTWTVTMPECSN